MPNLWIFGDSFSSNITNNGNISKLLELKGLTQMKSWGEILSEKLNYNFKNLAKGGISNYSIFQDFCDNCNLIEVDDIVIIGWGLLDKFRISVNNKFVDIHPYGFNEYKNFTKESIANFIKNRTECFDNQYKWADEIYSWENGITSLAKNKGFKIFFWSTEDNRIIYNKTDLFKLNRNYILPECKNTLISYLNYLGCTSIADESDNIIEDSHFGIEGHKKQAEIFYNEILK